MEDDLLNPDNRIPFLQHYWVAWGDHDTQWSAFTSIDNAVDYARVILDEAIMLYADGREEEALFQFGRLIHVAEDMGSPPHVFGDSHPGIDAILADLGHGVSVPNSLDKSGYEKWCWTNRSSLPASSAIEPVDDPAAAMESLATETFRSTRIPGELNFDGLHGARGDLAEIFPSPAHLAYLSKDPVVGLVEMWWLEGVGANFYGNRPREPNIQMIWPYVAKNDWVRVPNPVGEEGEYYYLENSQDTLVPPHVWSVGAGAYLPNVGGATLAGLWAGAGDLRATRVQAIETIPRTIEYVAGLMQHIWERVNPPPHLVGVRIEQDLDLDGAIAADGSELVYNRVWFDSHAPEGKPRTSRELRGRDHEAMRVPARLTLRFSEPVRRVWVGLEAAGAVHEIARDAFSSPGPPSSQHPRGEPLLRLPAVDLSAFPDGPVTILVRAEDLSPHPAGEDGSLDAEPATRAGRLPNGSWRWRERGEEELPTDRTHAFRLASFAVRASPPGAVVSEGGSARHCVEVRSPTLPEGTQGAFSLAGAAAGWTILPALTGEPLPFAFAPPGGAWATIWCGTVTAAGPAPASGLRMTATVAVGGAEARVRIEDALATAPGNDHPDDTVSVGDPRYPTPWLVDAAAPIGLLVSGWGQGLGHLLGRYGIATAPVSRDLVPLDGSAPDLSALRALLVGSGGLAGLERSATLRRRLSEFVAAGGLLVVLTPQRGSELEALPGEGVAGFGWTEDQACFGQAVEVAALHPVLSGQDALLLDAGADGYFTRWPDDAEVLLTRRTNRQPAMVRYPFGRGEVVVLTLYPDWAYGAGQSSAAERALVRDLATYALAFPRPVPLVAAGSPAAVTVPLLNDSATPTARAVVEVLVPDRGPAGEHVLDLPLEPDAAAEVALDLPAASALGIHPLSYRLLGTAGEVRQQTRDAAFFAAHAPLELPEPTRGVRLWVTTPRDGVPVGGTAGAVVHLLNATGRELRGEVAATWVHLGHGPLVTVPFAAVPSGTTASVPVDYPAPADSDFTVWYGFFEPEAPQDVQRLAAQALGSAMKGFSVFTPRIGIAIEAESARLLPGHALAGAVRLRSLTGEPVPTRLLLRLLSPSNREAWAAEAALELRPEGEVPFAITLAEAETGTHALEAVAVVGDTPVGAATVFLGRAPPGVSIGVANELPWSVGAENALALTLRNEELVTLGAGALRVTLHDGANDERWRAETPLPSLAPGQEHRVALAPLLTALAPGEGALRATVVLPEGETAIRLPLRHELRAAIDLGRGPAHAGGTLAARVSVENRGDFAVDGALLLAAESLPATCETPLRLAAGQSAVLPCALPIPLDASAGTHTVAASAPGTAGTVARTAVALAPARVEALPLPLSFDSGTGLELTLLNTGGVRGRFAVSARLRPAGAGDTDPPLAETTGVCDLAPGDDCSLSMTIPREVPASLCRLVVAAADLAGPWSAARDLYFAVNGPTATLAVETDRAAYASGEAVRVGAAVAAGPRPLEDARLELVVESAGWIDPPVFSGTVHVAPGGDDDGGDGSPVRPFATPQRAIDAAPNGARVLLHPGTYATGRVEMRPGTVLQGEVVGGALAATLEGADVVGASRTTLDHLRISGGNVVYPGAVDGVRITDCEVADVSRPADGLWTGIVFSRVASDVLVARTALRRLEGRRLGLVFREHAAGVRLLENSFADLASPEQGGIHFYGGADGASIQGNRFAPTSGETLGIHVADFFGAEPLRGLEVIGNRLEGLEGSCGGIHLWSRAEHVVLRGNALAGLSGDAGGIHAWGAVSDCTIADNTVRGLRGDALGVHLWGGSAESQAVIVENNLLEDLGPRAPGDRDNGLHLWGRTRLAAVRGNRLERIRDAAPEFSRSGLALGGAGSSGLVVERNIVTTSDIGVALRLQEAGSPSGNSGAVVANNLLLGNGVGLVEETAVDGGTADIRDNIIMLSAGPALRYAGPAALPATSRVRNNDLHRNGSAAEGRPDPVGADGNVDVDPRFVDAAAGDYRTLPSSPCRDAGTEPWLDIGPLDDDLDVALGPRPVAPAGQPRRLWATAEPIDLEAGGVLELERDAGPLPAAGQLYLRGRIASATGPPLAEAVAPFSVSLEPLRVGLRTERTAYRPGAAIHATVTAFNAGGEPIAGLPLTVEQDGAPVFAAPLLLAAGAGIELAFETAAEHDVVLRATAGLAVAELPIRVEAGRVEMSLEAPGEVGLGPFPLVVRLRNPGRLPLALSLDVHGERREVLVPPAGETAVVREVAVSADTRLVVRCTGDATALAALEVRCAVAPAAEIAAAPRYPSGAVEIPILVRNLGTAASEIPVRVALARAGAAPQTVLETVLWVEARGEVGVAAALGVLAPGRWNVLVEAGSALAEASFDVLPPVAGSFCGAAAVGEPDAEGNVPLEVCVRNDGSSGLEGELVATLGAATLRRAVTCPAGGEARFDLAVPTAGLPGGAGTVVIELVAGPALLDRAEVGLQLAPAPYLDALPAEIPLAAGGLTLVEVPLRNDGPVAAPVAVRLDGGDFLGDTVILSIPARSGATAAFPVAAPDDLPAGLLLPATVTLTDLAGGGSERAILPLRVAGELSPRVAHRFDLDGYRDGEVARLTVNVESAQPAVALPLRLLVSSASTRQWRDATLGPAAVVSALVGDFSGGAVLLEDGETAGSVTSSTFDLGADAAGRLAWEALVPDGASFVVEARSGPAPLPGPGWSAWELAVEGQPVAGGGRYLQYRATFAAAPDGASPRLHRLVLDCPERGLLLSYATAGELLRTPQQSFWDFPVDLSGEGTVHLGLYAPSGRSLHLETFPLPVRGTRLALSSERSRWPAGETLVIRAAVDAAGLLVLDTPWGSSTWAAEGPGSREFPFAVPALTRSGTHHARATFDGEEATLPLEIDGASLRILAAWLDRPAALPGEFLDLTIDALSPGPLGWVLLDCWIADGNSTVPVATSTTRIVGELSRRSVSFRVPSGPAGPVRLEFSVWIADVANPRALALASGSVVFDRLAPNAPPVAVAGPDRTAPERTWIALDGSESYDPDGDPLSFRWEQAGGPPAAVFGGETAQPLLLLPDVGPAGDLLTFRLAVSDGRAESDWDTVAIEVASRNRAPTADAGPDFTVAVGAEAVLDGSRSFDPDGDILGFAWHLVRAPEGSLTAPSDPSAVRSALLVDRPGDFEVRLLVTDGAASDDDLVRLSTVNSRPLADAGDDARARPGETVTLDGSASADPDGDALTFSWALVETPPGSTAAFAGDRSPRPSFSVDLWGRYVAELRVGDGVLESDPDTVTVSCENALPVADAGPDRAVRAGQVARLDGTGSRDDDGDAISHRWSFTAVPDGSLAALDEPRSPSPSFVADLPGTFVLSLVVTDGFGESAPDTVVVEAGPDAAEAVVAFSPARIRLGRPPRHLRASIELGEGFSAAEIDPDDAAIVSVGTRQLLRPVPRAAAPAPELVDADGDGSPELRVWFPVRPLRKRLRAGRNRVGIAGPLATWGRFLGSGVVRARR